MLKNRESIFYERNSIVILIGLWNLLLLFVIWPIELRIGFKFKLFDSDNLITINSQIREIKSVVKRNILLQK